MMVCLSLAACGGATTTTRSTSREPVVVTGADLPYTQADGAAARQAADTVCGPGGVRTSIYDRFEATTGSWVYPEGCA
jgi:hypothetical protein